GVDISWNRVKGSSKVQEYLSKAYSDFSAENPSAILPHLLNAYKEMQKLEGYWVEVKMNELKSLIIYCSGLWFEAGAKKPFAAKDATADFAISALSRGNFPVKWVGTSFPSVNLDIEANKELKANARLETINQEIDLKGLPVSQPYWLVEKEKEGVFQVNNQELIGLPENPPALSAVFTFDFEGLEIPFEIPAIHRYADPGIGELFRPFVITPKVTINLTEKVYLFANQQEQKVQLLVKSQTANQKVDISLKAAPGWSFSPPVSTIEFEKAGEEKILEILVTPPAEQSVSTLTVEANIEGEKSSYGLQTISYNHIPTQMLFPRAEAKLVQVNIEKRGNKIAYSMGSGDEVPVSLEQIGYQVDILEEDKFTLDNIRQYDAVIAGIRVYNTNKRMPYIEERILEYVKEGGTYLAQYNTTSRRGPGLTFGPFNLKVSRDRVSQEDAPVKILLPDHPALNFPNKITQKDFEGWIQERGLYFPNEWGEEYEALLEMNDKGESPKQGSLLVAKYGEGYIVYSGLSWFRELPAGVPGAYRLIANLISLGKKSR
ncbi:MAG: LmbE family protein, partial [Bacteroidota bacterium]